MEAKISAILKQLRDVRKMAYEIDNSMIQNRSGALDLKNDPGNTLLLLNDVEIALLQAQRVQSKLTKDFMPEARKQVSNSIDRQ